MVTVRHAARTSLSNESRIGSSNAPGCLTWLLRQHELGDLLVDDTLGALVSFRGALSHGGRAISAGTRNLVAAFLSAEGDATRPLTRARATACASPRAASDSSDQRARDATERKDDMIERL
jgi:hypothetical protein